MKKSLIILGSAFMFAATVVAQDEPLKSKNGHTILPESGDWSIGIDASPFFNYAGNFFNNTSNNQAPTWNGYTDNPFMITGKYFTDDNTAYRANLAIFKSGLYQTNEVTRAEALPLAPQFFTDPINKVVDTRKSTSEGMFVVGGGIEKRRGHGRLAGFYGGEVAFMFMGGSRTNYTYGNALTQNTSGDQPNVNPNDVTYTTNWGDNITNGNLDNFVSSSARLLESKTGASFGVGLRGFIGVEYFFAPKMAIGGEFGLGMGMMRMGATTNVWEAEGILADGSEAASIITDKLNRDMRRGWFVGSNPVDYLAPNGRLKLSFYF
jgi:hypothetical protein